MNDVKLKYYSSPEGALLTLKHFGEKATSKISELLAKGYCVFVMEDIKQYVVYSKFEDCEGQLCYGEYEDWLKFKKDKFCFK